MFISEKTSRTDLENAALLECDFDLEVVKNATDAELLAMIKKWILEGDECASC